MNIGYIYILKSQYGYKIGKTISVPNRVYIFTIKLPFEVSVVYTARVYQYNNVEKALHEMYKDKNIRGEWFNLTDGDVDEIKKVCEEKKVKKDMYVNLKSMKSKIDPRSYLKIKTDLNRYEFELMVSACRSIKYDSEFSYKEQLLSELYHYIIDDEYFHQGKVNMNLFLHKLENGDEEYHKTLWSKIWLYNHRYDG